MRLHRLSVQAFGPFADRVDVDFDDLADAGIFLIHGATGSGKTSLLDAICFALYGRVPGLRPSGEALRSDHAASDDVPEVELELTVSGRRLRVIRSPDHQRPKKRGTGLTPVRGQVRLEEWSPDCGWTTVATRADDVGDTLGQALGMGLDQFAKVVLLPQGDFAAFLRATAEDRRALLERLFDVRRYTGVEAWLAERRRVTAAAAVHAHAALAADLVRVDDVLGRVPPDVTQGLPSWPEASSQGRLGEAVTGAADSVRTHALAALAASDEADHKASAAEQAHAIATLAVQAARRGAAAQTVLSAFDGHATQRAQAADRLERGERAGRVAGDVRALRATRTILAHAEARATAALDVVAALSVAFGDSSADALERATQFDATLAEVTRLEVEERSRSQRRAALAADVRRAADQAASLDATDVTLAAQLHALEAQAEQLQGVAARAVGTAATLARAEQLVALREDIDESTRRIATLEAAGLAATRVALAQAGRLLDLRQRRLDGMAAELASGLQAGAQCPVCGSVEHPHRATQADVVTAADVEAAEQAWLPLDGRARTLEKELAAVRAHAETTMALLDGDVRDLPTLQAAAEAVRREWDSARAASDEVPRVQARLTELHERRKALAEARASAHATAATAQTVHGELTAAASRDEQVRRELVARHTAGCPCAIAEVAEVQVAQRHAQVVAALREATEAQTAAATARARHTEQHEATTAVCRAEGFADIPSVEAATVPVEQLAQIRQDLARDASAAAAARATLAEPEVAAALAAPLPDLDALTAAMVAARSQRTAAARTHALAEQSARDIEGLASQVQVSADAAATASRVAASTAALADVVAGLGSDNTLRMKLSAFVLAGRLERVVELANERLQRLGEGRFQLAHSDRLSAGGRRSGLGLVVEDQWTGQTRDTATLSGGESFMASLALALGLADAVREESGGIDLHTLFIDEGFGSLDSESLEHVMAVLDQLQDGGRAVGVVSHVPALRDRIPAQLRVDKSRRGSTVRRVTGPAA